MDEVGLCLCGHVEKMHEKHIGHCKEYNYGSFEMKCTCPVFSPFMILRDEETIHELTDELDTPLLEEPLDA